MPSLSAASAQHSNDGAQSFIIATSSAGAWRAYSGTTISPSAIIAKSSATHRILFGASNPQRSPRFRSLEARKVLAFRTNSSNSVPLTPPTVPSRLSASTRTSPAARNCENISSTKAMAILVRSAWQNQLYAATNCCSEEFIGAK